MNINKKAKRAADRLRRAGGAHVPFFKPSVPIMGGYRTGKPEPYPDDGDEMVLLDMHFLEDGSIEFSGAVVDAINDGLAAHAQETRPFPDPSDEPAADGSGFDLNDLK